MRPDLEQPSKAHIWSGQEGPIPPILKNASPIQSGELKEYPMNRSGLPMRLGFWGTGNKYRSRGTNLVPIPLRVVGGFATHSYEFPHNVRPGDTTPLIIQEKEDGIRIGAQCN